MTIDTKNRDKQQKHTQVKECLTFLGLAGVIYICYITSGIYHQKILKFKYLNPDTGERSYFQEAIIFTLFPQLVATIIGFVYKMFSSQSNPNRSGDQVKRQIPWTKAIICGLLVNFNMFTYNQAVVQASFPAVVMVKSCSLLSVIIVGVFCSRVKDKGLKLKSNKLVIGILACIGIFVFNYFKITQKDSIDKPITLISSLLLIASLIGDGFLPDLQAQLKSEYKPTVMEMYLQINKYTFLVAFIFSLVTGKIFYFYQFFRTHQQIVMDIAVLSILNALGQIIIYKMIKLYKQHIPAFVIGIRKCLTVVVNILYFGHSINTQQFFAIAFVFCSIMWETYDNYLDKQKKQLEKNVVSIPLDIKDQMQALQSSQKTQNGQSQIDVGQQTRLRNRSQ